MTQRGVIGLIAVALVLIGGLVYAGVLLMSESPQKASPPARPTIPPATQTTEALATAVAVYCVKEEARPSPTIPPPGKDTPERASARIGFTVGQQVIHNICKEAERRGPWALATAMVSAATAIAPLATALPAAAPTPLP